MSFHSVPTVCWQSREQLYSKLCMVVPSTQRCTRVVCVGVWETRYLAGARPSDLHSPLQPYTTPSQPSLSRQGHPRFITVIIVAFVSDFRHSVYVSEGNGIGFAFIDWTRFHSTERFCLFLFSSKGVLDRVWVSRTGVLSLPRFLFYTR